VEDLGVWVTGQRAGWERLMPAQQYLLESIGIEPLGEGEAAVGAPKSQDARWAANLAAAQQFHAREGHLRPARKHVEIVDGEPHRLGAFLDNTRRRAGKLSPERRAQLAALGLEWAQEGGA
ncbi:helicase associated domain-containing protein, partial [Streptomyces sp. NPDC127084]|uniref:helicase associated domain-containing protein n=1 Tax=Streptomyces sp. NPDC127084 TaxID=3347133 RepID=UPI003654CFF9